jgi:hypothetical protein
MSPIEAINKLYELKKKAEDGGYGCLLFFPCVKIS